MLKSRPENHLGLGDQLGYGWAICGLALTQYVTPMTAKPADEPKIKKDDKPKKIFRVED